MDVKKKKVRLERSNTQKAREQCNKKDLELEPPIG